MPKLLPEEIKSHFPCLQREESGGLLHEMCQVLPCKHCIRGPPNFAMPALQSGTNFLQDTLWSTWTLLPLRRGET